MRPFYKLALLLGVVSVVSLQGHSAQEPRDSLAMDFRTVSMAGQSAQNKLANTIVRYIVENHEQELHKLFNKPNVNAWSTLYQQVTGQQFSILGLVNLLDQTKTKIFGNRVAIEQSGLLNYFNVPLLLDTAMRQIFEGCWGISDEPVAAGVINHLKGVYGRVVSDILVASHDNQRYQVVSGIAQSLEDKKADVSAKVSAHLTALQECIAAVMYTHATQTAAQPVGGFLEAFNKQTGASLSQPSFKALLEIVRYQNPVDVVPETGGFSILQRTSLSAARLSIGIYPTDFETLSKLNPETQANHVLFSVRHLSEENDIDALTPQQQDQLLDLFGKARETLKDNAEKRLDSWHRLMPRRNKNKPIFRLESILSRILKTYKDVTFPTITDSLEQLVGDLDRLSRDSQLQFVKLLSQALAKNKSPQRADDKYALWVHLLNLTNEKGQSALPVAARSAIVGKAIQSLGDIPGPQHGEIDIGKADALHRCLTLGERKLLIKKYSDLAGIYAPKKEEKR